MKSLKLLENLSASEIHQLDIEKARAEGVTIDGNLPFYMPGNEIGVLMIHGITASPYFYIRAAETLNSRGYTTYGVRIAGHAGNNDEYNKYSYHDWYESLQYGYSLLRQECSTIVVVGHSMGGLLATILAKYNDVDAVVLCAPAFVTPRITKATLWLKHVVKKLPKSPIDDDLKGYLTEFWPVNALAEMLRAQKEAVKILPDLIDREHFNVFIGNKDLLVPADRLNKLLSKYGSSAEILKPYNDDRPVMHDLITYDEGIDAMVSSVQYHLSHIRDKKNKNTKTGT